MLEKKERVECLERRFRRAGIPEGAWGLTAGDLEAVPEAKCFVDDEAYRKNGKGLYIYGPVGAGKTWAATAVVCDLVRRGETACIVSEPILIAEIQAAMDVHSRSPLVVLREYAEVRTLVIDDVGKGYATPWSLSQLFALIDERVKAKRSVVLTSQYDIDKLGDLWARVDVATSEAILSRIRGMTSPVFVDGPDRRW